MMAQAENPFDVDYSDNFHNVLAFRIIVPLFNHFIGLRGYWIILPSLLGSYLLLIVSSRILEKYHNQFNTRILLISLSTSYLFVSGTNFWEAYDSLAIAIILLVVLLKPFWIQSILIFLANLSHAIENEPKTSKNKSNSLGRIIASLTILMNSLDFEKGKQN